jgi:hypothetical protein
MKSAAEEPVDHLPLLTDPVPSLPAGNETEATGEGEGYDPYNSAPVEAQPGNR